MPTTIYDNADFSDTPFGLKLQQTITSSGAVSVPSNVKRVYAVCIGGGGGGGTFSLPNVRNITAISGDGTTVTYTCANNFVAGMSVTTTGSSIAGYNVTTATIATASATNFTVTNATTGTPTLTNATAEARTITTGAAAGGSITAVTASSPATGQVTYSTTTAVPVGCIVTVAGASPSGYNGTFVVVATNIGTSFTVNNATTGAATGTITFTGVVRYTAVNNLNVGSIVDMNNHNPSGFNISGGVVVRATATEYTVVSSLAQSTTWVSGGQSKFVASNNGGAGGGGAGGYSAGWTTVPTTCTVGAGGAGGQMGMALVANSSSLFFANNPNGHGKYGDSTIFGQVFAGGGAGGNGCNPTENFAGLTPFMGGAGSGSSSQITTTSIGGASYTGAPATSSIGGNFAGYAGAGSTGVGFAGVSGGGGGGITSAMTGASLTGNNGGRGLIGGGAGSVIGLNTVTGGSGGAGDRFAGGSGSSGTGIGVGAGGGGGGYIAAGSNASGNNGGNGGDGGGGGGAGNANGTGGNGGNGVIYLYY